MVDRSPPTPPTCFQFVGAARRRQACVKVSSTKSGFPSETSATRVSAFSTLLGLTDQVADERGRLRAAPSGSSATRVAVPPRPRYPAWALFEQLRSGEADKHHGSGNRSHSAEVLEQVEERRVGPHLDVVDEDDDGRRR